jgi:hypothetical protein
MSPGRWADQCRRADHAAVAATGGAYGRRMAADVTRPNHDDSTVDDMVAKSALQLWSAAQTDVDPLGVPSDTAL